MSDNGEISHIGRYVDIVVKRLRGRFPSYWGRKKRRTRPTRHHSTGEQTNLCCCEDSVMTKHDECVCGASLLRVNAWFACSAIYAYMM